MESENNNNTALAPISDGQTTCRNEPQMNSSRSAVDLKLDPNQLTYDSDEEKIVIWRKLLQARYYDKAGDLDNVHVEWTDFNSSCKPINTGDDHTQFTTVSPCPELYKTVIRIKVNKKKLLTITVYLTTHRVLVQGVACQEWLHGEFDRLDAIVQSIAKILGQGGNTDHCAALAKDHPFPPQIDLPSQPKSLINESHSADSDSTSAVITEINPISKGEIVAPATPTNKVPTSSPTTLPPPKTPINNATMEKLLNRSANRLPYSIPPKDKMSTSELDEKVTKKLSEVESSVCGLLMDVKKCLSDNITSDHNPLESKLETLGQKVDSIHTDVSGISKSILALDKQMKQLTDATNKKFSHLSHIVSELSQTHTKGGNTTTPFIFSETTLVASDQSAVSEPPHRPTHSAVATLSHHPDNPVIPTNLSTQLSENGDSSESDGEVSDNESSNGQSEAPNKKQLQTPTLENSQRSSQSPTASTRQAQQPADLLIIGNSNTKFIHGNKVYSKKNCKVVSLRNKSIVGAQRYVIGMRPNSPKPCCAAFLVGTNEVGRSNDNKIIDEYEQLIDACRAKMPDTSLVMMGIPTRKGNSDVLERINSRLQHLCERENISFVDNSGIDYHDHLCEDKIHLNESGLKILVSALKKVTNPILGVKSNSSSNGPHNNYRQSGARPAQRNSWRPQISPRHTERRTTTHPRREPEHATHWRERHEPVQQRPAQWGQRREPEQWTYWGERHQNGDIAQGPYPDSPTHLSSPPMSQVPWPMSNSSAPLAQLPHVGGLPQITSPFPMLYNNNGFGHLYPAFQRGF